MKKTMIVLGVLLTFTANATTEREKAELARIAKELKYFKHDVLQVSKLRRVDDTEAFNYEAFVRDLDAIQKAVVRHIDMPSRQPKVLEPLEAEYGNIQ